MKRHYKILALLLVVLAGGLFGYMRSANATITITPMVVVIEGRDRFADVNVINSSGKDMSYAVDWLYFKMIGDDGAYEELTSSLTEWDLAKHIVYTPKRFSLKPSDLQKVRLGLRLNGEPPAPGDYRAHLLIKQAKPPVASTTPMTQEGQPKARVGVSIDVGFSIPVIYRSGVSDATAHIGDISVKANAKSGRPDIVIPVERRGGPFGLIGSIFVYNNDKLVGELPNANIFSEVNSRTFVIGATTNTLEPGTIRVVYKDYNKKKETIYAEKSVPYAK